jgi:Flp pilus assembly CpaE family ATPase
LINPATAELAAAAQNIFIVCEPELASLKMTGIRRAELEAVGVPSAKICVLANRWDAKRLTRAILEHTAGLPMYAALPNDYQEVKNASMESRVVSAQSAFAIACATLARRVSGRPQLEPEGAISSILRKIPGLRVNTKVL